MSDSRTDGAKPFDFGQSLTGMRDAYLDAMAKVMIETVNTEGYAQASGAMLDSCLTASVPFRQALESSMTQALQQLSMPSRQEVAALGDRVTHVEMRLDDMDAKLDQIVKLLSEQPRPPAGPSRPARAAAPARGTKTATRRKGGGTGK